MKALKKIKTSLIALSFFLIAAASVFAQSDIGMKLPPLDNEVPLAFKKLDLDFNKTPIEVDDALFLKSYFSPAAFNSPFIDQALSTFAQLNSYHADLPFFCRIEFQMEQATRFPVKIRLGDIQFVDRMESKVDWELGN